MTILINCTGKFCYRRGKFQNTETASGGVLKNFTKFIGKHPCQSFFFNKVAGLWPATLFKKRLQHRCFSVSFVNFQNTFFRKRLFLKIWKLTFDCRRPQLSDEKLFWKYLENIQDHICIGLQVSLSYRFRKTKDWLNPHNYWNKVPQNLENKFTGLHFSKAFFSGLICRCRGYFWKSLFHQYKNKLNKSKKSWEDVKISKIVLLQ